MSVTSSVPPIALLSSAFVILTFEPSLPPLTPNERHFSSYVIPLEISQLLSFCPAVSIYLFEAVLSSFTT